MYIVVTLLALVVGALISRVITVHQVRRGRVRACGRIYLCKDSGPAG